MSSPPYIRLRGRPEKKRGRRCTVLSQTLSGRLVFVFNDQTKNLFTRYPDLAVVGIQDDPIVVDLFDGSALASGGEKDDHGGTLRRVDLSQLDLGVQFGVADGFEHQNGFVIANGYVEDYDATTCH